MAQVTAGNTTKASDINQIIIPGLIAPYGGTSAPTGWLLCDGTSYLRTTHAALFGIIGTAYGTADGTHFNVPDFRGQFLRGFDDGEGTDPDAAGRTAMATGGATGDAIGSIQADAFQGHVHYFGQAVSRDSGANDSTSPTTNNTTKTGSPIDDGSNGTPRTTTESRPVNASVNYIIKT